LEIETKLASIERNTVSAIAPKPKDASKSSSKHAKSTYSNDDSSKKQNSHRSQRERSRHREHEPKAPSANGQTRTKTPSTNSAPQIARVNSSSFNRTNSSTHRPSSRHDDGSNISVGPPDRVGLSSGSRSESTRLILAAAEQRSQMLQAENAKLLLQIAQLTQTTNEQQKTIVAAEERNVLLRKELEQATTSLANKVCSCSTFQYLSFIVARIFFTISCSAAFHSFLLIV
jgi:hypothetical protein